jgi:hypothetical protein
MTISPRDVSSKTLMVSQALVVKFRESSVLTVRFKRPFMRLS